MVGKIVNVDGGKGQVGRILEDLKLKRRQRRHVGGEVLAPPQGRQALPRRSVWQPVEEGQEGEDELPAGCRRRRRRRGRRRRGHRGRSAKRAAAVGVSVGAKCALANCAHGAVGWVEQRARRTVHVGKGAGLGHEAKLCGSGHSWRSGLVAAAAGLVGNGDIGIGAVDAGADDRGAVERVGWRREQD